MKPHIAFFIIPAHGHINPTLPVVAALVRRGYRVTYAATEAFAAKVAAAGAEVVPYTSKLFAPRPAGDRLQQMRNDIIDEIDSAARQLHAFYSKQLPHLILYDQVSYVGELFAIGLEAPCMRLWSTFANNEHYRGVRDGAPQYESIQLNFMQRIAEFFAHRGIVDSDRRRNAPRAHIAFLPRAFQYRGETFDERYHFVGPCLGERDDGDWQPPAGGRPVLLISLGTLFAWPEFFAMCADAFADNGWRIVMVAGNQYDSVAARESPDNFEVHRFAPQLEVLQHAAAFISHGGMNGVMEALYYGVPLIVIPQKPEQETIARRVVELGLGLQLRKAEVTAAALRAALAGLRADTALDSRLRAMQMSIREGGGAERAADAIEEVLFAQLSPLPI